METFDKVWEIVVIVVPMVMSIVTMIVSATPSPKDNELWGKIALILGRVFSFTTFQNSQGKTSVSLPVLQSAKPKE